MYWLATRSAVVSFPRWRCLALLLRSTARRRSSFSSLLTLRSRELEQICCLKGQKVLKGNSKTTKKYKASYDSLSDKDLSHLLWWKKKLEKCRKPLTVQLVKRLTYSNLLGFDVNSKDGRKAYMLHMCPGCYKRKRSNYHHSFFLDNHVLLWSKRGLPTRAANMNLALATQPAYYCPPTSGDNGLMEAFQSLELGLSVAKMNTCCIM